MRFRCEQRASGSARAAEVKGICLLVEFVGDRS